MTIAGGHVTAGPSLRLPRNFDRSRCREGGNHFTSWLPVYLETALVFHILNVDTEVA